MFPRRGGGGVVVIVERGRLLVLVWMPPGPPACMHFLSLSVRMEILPKKVECIPM